MEKATAIPEIITIKDPTTLTAMIIPVEELETILLLVDDVPELDEDVDEDEDEDADCLA